MRVSPETIELYYDLAKQVTYNGRILSHKTFTPEFSSIDRLLAAWDRGDNTLIDKILGYPMGLKKHNRGLGKRSDRAARRGVGGKLMDE